jgi:hypothetical protein
VVVVKLVGYIIIALKKKYKVFKKQIIRIELKKILVFQNEHLDKKFGV